MTKRIVLLQSLASTPKAVLSLLEGLEERAFHHRLAPDHWSVVEVVNHLLDVEKRYLKRLETVVAEENPLLPAILPQGATTPLGADQLPSPFSIASKFERSRSKTLIFLQELSPEQWRRPAVHETLGEVTLHFLVQNLVNHDVEHLSQFAEIRQSLQREVPEGVHDGSEVRQRFAD